jgi:outer membrane protein OmpA-like peptidoglycan-associated protein
MGQVRSGHLVFGVALIVAGYAVLVIALAKQAQHMAAAGTTQAAAEPAPSATPTPPTVTAAATATATAVATAAPTPSAAAAVASAAPSSSAAPASGDSALEGDGHMFKFSPGGALMSREEVQRLMAFGKIIAHRPSVKVSIEGFGDTSGLEPLMAGIAKHRAKTAQMLLTKSGVSEDRITTAVADMGTDQRLARSIRVTTMPPVPEADKP